MQNIIFLSETSFLGCKFFNIFELSCFRNGSDCADTQADFANLNLRWSHTSYCRCCRVLALIYSLSMCLETAGHLANSANNDQPSRSLASVLDSYYLNRIICPSTWSKYGGQLA